VSVTILPVPAPDPLTVHVLPSVLEQPEKVICMLPTVFAPVISPVALLLLHVIGLVVLVSNCANPPKPVNVLDVPGLNSGDAANAPDVVMALTIMMAKNADPILLLCNISRVSLKAAVFGRRWESW
jgi:hypothetical protein